MADRDGASTPPDRLAHAWRRPRRQPCCHTDVIAHSPRTDPDNVRHTDVIAHSPRLGFGHFGVTRFDPRSPFPVPRSSFLDLVRWFARSLVRWFAGSLVRSFWSFLVPGSSFARSWFLVRSFLVPGSSFARSLVLVVPRSWFLVRSTSFARFWFLVPCSSFAQSLVPRSLVFARVLAGARPSSDRPGHCGWRGGARRLERHSRVTRHEERGTRHEARGTRNEARGTRNEERGTRNEERGTRNEERARLRSVRSKEEQSGQA